jgi:hypothetical protein
LSGRIRPGDTGAFHGELLVLGVKVAASTVWEIMRAAGIDPAPDRAATTWAQFLRSRAEALVAVDFLDTITLTGIRLYVLAAIENASRRIRILGATAHPTASWMTHAARNLVMDLEDAGCQVKHLIRDRDGKYPSLIDTILAIGCTGDARQGRRPGMTGHPHTPGGRQSGCQDRPPGPFAKAGAPERPAA